MARLLVGSTHSEVPVKPVWPKAVGASAGPAEQPGELASCHPRPRACSNPRLWSAVARLISSGLKNSPPPRSIAVVGHPASGGRDGVAIETTVSHEPTLGGRIVRAARKGVGGGRPVPEFVLETKGFGDPLDEETVQR